MTLNEAILTRHSVREYTDAPLTAEQVETLNNDIFRCNREGNLHLQLVTNEPNCFQAEKPHYGKFRGVRNYIALIGPRGKNLDERLGYFGEQVVLLAQTLGLNTCWVGLTYKKTPDALRMEKGEVLRGVIALGVGVTQGVQHKSKSFEAVTEGKDFPDWFCKGVEAALLAPTAINQQKFRFKWDGGVSVKAGIGFFAHMDLGIVASHFEIASGQSFFLNQLQLGKP
ncbi:MAG: nitroreductase [Bacteroidaceae bacterium]|nr:nitroreductase [Bacteroidaceae bacterium]